MKLTQTRGSDDSKLLKEAFAANVKRSSNGFRINRVGCDTQSRTLYLECSRTDDNANLPATWTKRIHIKKYQHNVSFYN
jgi:hypothetical protein